MTATALLLILLIGAGSVASVSDLREGKIYNKHMAAFGLAGLAVYAAFYPQISTGALLGQVTNATTCLIVAFLLFYTRFWSAGDAKLFCLMAILIPYGLYPLGMLFPAFYLLMVIFGLAFVYAVVESVYYYLADARRPANLRRSARNVVFTRSALGDWLLRYLAGSFLLGFVYSICGHTLSGAAGA